MDENLVYDPKQFQGSGQSEHNRDTERDGERLAKDAVIHFGFCDQEARRATCRSRRVSEAALATTGCTSALDFAAETEQTRPGAIIEKGTPCEVDMMDTPGAKSSVDLGAAAANEIVTKQAARHRVAPEAKAWFLDHAA